MHVKQAWITGEPENSALSHKHGKQRITPKHIHPLLYSNTCSRVRAYSHAQDSFSDAKLLSPGDAVRECTAGCREEISFSRRVESWYRGWAGGCSVTNGISGRLSDIGSNGQRTTLLINGPASTCTQVVNARLRC